MTRHDMRSRMILLRDCSTRCRELAELLAAECGQSEIARLLHRVAGESPQTGGAGREAPRAWEILAQSLVATRIAWESAGPTLRSLRERPGLFPPADSLLGQVIRLAVADSTDSRVPGAGGPTAQAVGAILSSVAQQGTGAPDFDSFLAWHDPRSRARHGVYFTPRPLAAFVVREVDQFLKEEFHLPDGLADTAPWRQRGPSTRGFSRAQSDDDRPFVHVLDPAAGAGVFLVEVVERIHANWLSRTEVECIPGSERMAAWNEYVTRYLIPRLSAFELLLPACAVAWIHLADKLATTGYRFESVAPLQLALGDSLAGPPQLARPATVIVGNPPFSALTTSGNVWIDGLLRSGEWNGRNVGGFYESDGKPLNERKLWLHDDYVKFLRVAQWLIESAGAGVVGLVTNHGYLDNLTFRGVRQSLLASFPRIRVLDLHGNRKKREVAPGGERDENVFGIDQGIAVGLFRQTAEHQTAKVERGDLWGTRTEKITAVSQLEGSISWHPVVPAAPHYLFESNRIEVLESEYSRGFPIDEVMPVHSTAAVTARDSFVIAFTPAELLERMQLLADPNWSDDELRRRYFFRTRSRRYPPGDSRSWKLPAARQRMCQIGDARPLLQRCLYRPFDWRWIVWADWMVDWPRNRIMRHMLPGDNLALITRRQMIPNQPANYFFVSDAVVIDGLIRSDNRGSESFFPLYLADDEAEPGRRCNFSREFIQACAPLQSGRELAAEDLFALLYAQFHSPGYRQRYQAELCLGFPRVFIPHEPWLAEKLVATGKVLVDAHLMRDLIGQEPDVFPDAEPGTAEVSLLHRGWPRLVDDRLEICPSWSLEPVARDTWQFHVGGYQVCRKWLRERAGRVLSLDEREHYARIVAAVETTRRTMQEIDRWVDQAGGWPRAFRGRSL